jgi:hypothetical protein
MPAYGYSSRVVDDKFGLLQLREVSFDLSPTQLRSVAAFLTDCADRLDNGSWRSDHVHMPRPPAEVDIIVLIPSGQDTEPDAAP